MRRRWFCYGAITASLLFPGLGSVLAIRLYEWNLDRHTAVESPLHHRSHPT